MDDTRHSTHGYTTRVIALVAMATIQYSLAARSVFCWVFPEWYVCGVKLGEICYYRNEIPIANIMEHEKYLQLQFLMMLQWNASN